jgi:hypothetical protein
MIIFFNEQPVSKKVKIKKALDVAQIYYGSEYFAIQNNSWFGDSLTVESLFPEWILKEYESNPENVFVIPIIKNYFRWLFSINYGYGAQLEWEYIREPLKINSIFLETFSDFYFPNADFSSSPLKEILPNIKKFLINVDSNYNDSKGTIPGIKYIISNLLGFDLTKFDIITANSGIIHVSLDSSIVSDFEQYKPFLQEHVFPIGMAINYGVK